MNPSSAPRLPAPLPLWSEEVVSGGVQPERSPGGTLALWLPAGRAGWFRFWERVGAVPRSEFTVAPGVGGVRATLVRARQPLGGALGRLWRRLAGAPRGESWTLPDGTTAEQYGARRTDLLLVRAEGAGPLHAAVVRALWPACSGVRQLGEGLFLVEGVDAPGPADGAAPEAGPGCPRRLAEYLLAKARSAGDRRREAAALTDLGLIELHEGQLARATALLEEALAAARPLGDRALAGDVQVHLGLALTLAGQPRRALPLLDEALSTARETADRFAERAALERSGLAHAHLGDPARALAYFEPALALAAAAGDRKQQAELLWHLAVQQADLGRHEWAVVHARSAVDLLREANDPRAVVFAEHLRRYAAEAPAPSALAVPAGVNSVVINAGAAAPQAPAPVGVLKMALGSARSAARFAGSGFKAAPEAVLRHRLRTCAACAHHTGLRCRLCGCFTNVKARLAHETCPAGKWPG